MPLAALNTPLNVAKAEFFKALGHPARIRILELLSGGARTVSSLIDETSLEPPALSQHLAVLRRIGLVEPTRKGTSISYELADPTMPEFLDSARAVLLTSLARAKRLLDEIHESLL